MYFVVSFLKSFEARLTTKFHFAAFMYKTLFHTRVHAKFFIPDDTKC
jgi:hypothetical protein